MKKTATLATLAMAATALHAGTVNWVIENPEGLLAGGHSGAWGFLIHDKDAPPFAPLDNELPYASGGAFVNASSEPIIMWDSDNEKLVFQGGGEISAISYFMGGWNEVAKYAVDDHSSYGVNEAGSPFPFIEIAGSTDAGQPVYNEGFTKINSNPTWDPGQGYYYILLFDPEKEEYTVVNPIQELFVSFDDVTVEYLGNGQLDPFFPAGDELKWYKLDSTDTNNPFDPGKYGSAYWTTIPEPTTALLAGLGCVVLGLRRRARRG